MDKSKSINLLNRALGEELQAIEQYLYFHFHCENRGYTPLSKIFMRVSMAEMKHMDLLAQRILFLDGDVNMAPAGPVVKISNVEDMLKNARDLEQGSINDYNTWANESAANADSATKKLFEYLVCDEEEHWDIFDIEIKNLAAFGDSYLALQSITHSKEAAKGEAKS